MNKYYLRSKVICILLLIYILVTTASGSVYAASSKAPKAAAATATTSSSGSTNISGSLIQSYNANSTVLTGMIVMLKAKSQDVVVPLTYKESTNMLGVVIPVNNATISLTPQTSSSTEQVLVSTSGNYITLVSTQGGPIKAGDFLTMSSIAGIAMKANKEQQQVVGRAIGSFTGANALETTPITGGTGQPKTVSIGSIPVDLRLAPNPEYHTSNTLPGAVTKTANAVAGKEVGLPQVYLSLTLLILTFFVTGIIYYGAVRSSIISIGRNPLSKKSIILGLIKVLTAGSFIFSSGVIAAYLVLKT